MEDTEQIELTETAELVEEDTLLVGLVFPKVLEFSKGYVMAWVVLLEAPDKLPLV